MTFEPKLQTARSKTLSFNHQRVLMSNTLTSVCGSERATRCIFHSSSECLSPSRFFCDRTIYPITFIFNVFFILKWLCIPLLKVLSFVQAVVGLGENSESASGWIILFNTRRNNGDKIRRPATGGGLTGSLKTLIAFLFPWDLLWRHIRRAALPPSGGFFFRELATKIIPKT